MLEKRQWLCNKNIALQKAGPPPVPLWRLQHNNDCEQRIPTVALRLQQLITQLFSNAKFEQAAHIFYLKYLKPEYLPRDMWEDMNAAIESAMPTSL